MTGIAGEGTTIAKAFMAMRPNDMFMRRRCAELPPDLDAYLICAGYLAGKSLAEISHEQAERTWNINFIEPARLCDRIIAAKDKVRICLIGSQSGIRGSHDMAYAGAKAALHLYVRTKRLRTPDQQIVCLAPHIIADSGMTGRRSDQDRVEASAAAHRAGRHITAAEVAEVAALALFEATIFLSNTVIDLGGDR